MKAGLHFHAAGLEARPNLARGKAQGHVRTPGIGHQGLARSEAQAGAALGEIPVLGLGPAAQSAEDVALEILRGSRLRGEGLPDQARREGNAEVPLYSPDLLEGVVVEPYGADALLAFRVKVAEDLLDRVLCELSVGACLVPDQGAEIERRLGRRDVQQASTVDRVDTSRAQVPGGFEQDIGGFGRLGRKPGPAVLDEGRRARDQGRCQGSPGGALHPARIVFHEDELTRGDQKAVHQPGAGQALAIRK